MDYDRITNTDFSRLKDIVVHPVRRVGLEGKKQPAIFTPSKKRKGVAKVGSTVDSVELLGDDEYVNGTYCHLKTYAQNKRRQRLCNLRDHQLEK